MPPDTSNIEKVYPSLSKSSLQSTELTDNVFKNEEDSEKANDLEKKNLYQYVHQGQWGIVWRNVVLFIVLHLLSFWGLYAMWKETRLKTIFFAQTVGSLGGLGVTAGAHRLWSHRSYKAKLPLRIFLMICQTIAGQEDIVTWCRDHRLHHKFCETDADPYNIKRGYFFAHMGWLMMKKHPDVKTKGKFIQVNDLLEDPVVRFQKRYYFALAILVSFILPTAIPAYVWDETWLYSFLVAGVSRYVLSLHSAWFVNSTAHMFGSRPFNVKILSRDNAWVSSGGLGEGYHNYHHTFPWDYAASEMGSKINLTKMFIDLMEKVGLAYDLKRTPEKYVKERKAKIEKDVQKAS